MKRLSVIFICIMLIQTALLPGAAQSPEEALFPTENWESSSPEAQGLDSATLAELVRSLTISPGNHGITVIRNGYMILDAYPHPYDANTPHNLFSVTKSIISILIGIAIDQGYIESVDQPVLPYFQDYSIENLTPYKEAITIEHLLTMTSGLQILDDHMYASSDWVEYLLNRRSISQPGTRFSYADGNPHLLSAILTEVTGKSTLEFAQEQLFNPLGITNVRWLSDPQGINQGGSELWMTPNDMAKIGYLFLNEGRWGDQQLVSPEWVAASTSVDVQDENSGLSGYGYLWWSINPAYVYEENFSASYAAVGFSGQIIWVSPDLNMVVALTAKEKEPLEIISMITKAVISDEALPENPDGLVTLNSYIETFAHPVPKEVDPLPALAETIEGQTYILDANEYGWESFNLRFTEQEAILTLAVNGTTFEVPIGLDGIARVTSFTLNPPEMEFGIRGNWVNDNRFGFVLSPIGNIFDMAVSLTFREDGTVRVQVTTATYDSIPNDTFSGVPQG